MLALDCEHINKPRKPIFTEHRRKRLTLWALTVLGWLMSVLFGNRDVSVRHLKQRLDYIFLDELTDITRALLVSRALEFAKAPNRGRAISTPRAPPDGFR